MLPDVPRVRTTAITRHGRGWAIGAPVVGGLGIGCRARRAVRRRYFIAPAPAAMAHMPSAGIPPALVVPGSGMAPGSTVGAWFAAGALRRTSMAMRFRDGVAASFVPPAAPSSGGGGDVLLIDAARRRRR